MKDFFISYTNRDEAWAEWIAWELEAHGYTVVMQKWNFAPGSNFAVEMETAIIESRKLLLVLSNNSLSAPFVSAEWKAFFNRDPEGKSRLIIPIRVDSCEPQGLLAQIVYLDINNLTEHEARIALMRGIGHIPTKPLERPIFPGSTISANLISPDFPLSP